MNWIYNAYLLAVGFTVATTLILAWIAWLRRSIPGAIPFALAMLAIAEVASMYFLFTVTVDSEVAFVWTKLRFLGLAIVPVLYFIFIMHYTGKEHWMSGKIILGLCVIPLLTQLVLWFGPTTLFFQHWELVRVGSISMENSQFTRWFWVHFVYSNVLLLVVVARLAYYVVRVDRSAVGGALWIIAGVLLGLLGAVPGTTVGQAPGLKFMPLGLGLTGVATMIALMRYRLFDIIPIAYDAIFSGMQDAIILTDDLNSVIQANPAAQSLMRIQIPNLIGVDIRDVLNLNNTALQRQNTQSQTEFMIVRDKETFNYDVHISPLFRRDRFVGQLIVLYDITERKRAENRFRALLESAPDAMVIVNKQGAIVLVNSQAETLFGYGREELVGKPIELLIPEHLRERHVTHRDGYIADPHIRGMGAGLELIAYRKDGSQFLAEISLSPIETAEGVLIASAVRDITERKLAEKRFQTLLESAPDAMVIVNKQGNIVLVNSQSLTVFGYTRDELVGNSIDLLIPARFHGSHHLHVDSYVSGAVPQRVGVGMRLELYAKRKDGSEFPVEISLSPIETADGNLIVSAVRDITERRRAENALRESEGRFRQIMDHLDQAFWLREAGSGQMIYMSPAYETITGCSLRTLYDDPESLLQAVHSEDRAQVAKAWAQDNSAEYRIVRPDGSIRWVLARLFRIDDEEIHLHRIAGITEDITERKLAEQRALELAIEKDRVSLLRNFIHDISHEFRTPMAIIDSTTYILSRTEDAEQRGVLRKRVNVQVQRLVRILEDMLVMSELDMQSVGALTGTSVHVNQLISAVMTVIAPVADGKHLRATRNLDSSLIMVPGDPETLRQAVFNVVQNAVNYTPEGGSTTVQTSRTDSAVLIEVMDTGIGIHAEDLAHIFERFYRADKARTLDDNGTGLGLSIASRILELHRGKIEVKSTPGQGSTFRLVLPLASDDSVTN